VDGQVVDRLEAQHGLLHAVLEDGEFRGLEAEHRTLGGVDDRGEELHEVDVDLLAGRRAVDEHGVLGEGAVSEVGGGTHQGDLVAGQRDRVAEGLLVKGHQALVAAVELHAIEGLAFRHLHVDARPQSPAVSLAGHRLDQTHREAVGAAVDEHSSLASSSPPRSSAVTRSTRVRGRAPRSSSTL
jgi:hypothetical protein